MVKTNGDEINVICNTEKQMDEVVQRLSTDTVYYLAMKNGMKERIKSGY